MLNVELWIVHVQYISKIVRFAFCNLSFLLMPTQIALSLRSMLCTPDPTQNKDNTCRHRCYNVISLSYRVLYSARDILGGANFRFITEKSLE